MLSFAIHELIHAFLDVWDRPASPRLISLCSLPLLFLFPLMPGGRGHRGVEGAASRCWPSGVCGGWIHSAKAEVSKNVSYSLVESCHLDSSGSGDPSQLPCPVEEAACTCHPIRLSPSPPPRVDHPPHRPSQIPGASPTRSQGFTHPWPHTPSPAPPVEQATCPCNPTRPSPSPPPRVWP